MHAPHAQGIKPNEAFTALPVATITALTAYTHLLRGLVALMHTLCMDQHGVYILVKLTRTADPAEVLELADAALEEVRGWMGDARRA